MASLTIPSGVTNIQSGAFNYCYGLTSIYCEGNAPSLLGGGVFTGDSGLTIYYLPGTTGWDQWVSPPPAALWNPQPQSVVVQTNQFGFAINGMTNIPLVVEASTNLTRTNWTPLQACTLTNGSVYFSDPQWTNYPARFYRLRWQQ